MSDHIADVRKKDNNWGLIDKQALHENCYEVYQEALVSAPSALARDHAKQMLLKIEQKIKSAPTVDAVEVVRCNDCKDNCTGRVDSGTIWCDRFHARRPLDAFCSYGERREGE